MKQGMKKIMAFVLTFALALVSAVAMPTQARAASQTKYVETSEKTYLYDGSTKKYTLDSTLTYKYNKKGLVLEQKYTSKSAGYSSAYKYTYDKKGNVKTLKTYEYGKLSAVNKYTYDKKGRIKTDKTLIYYKGSVNYSYTHTYKYSKDGKSATVSSNAGDGYTAKYTYYSNGNIKTIKQYQSGVLQYERSFDKYENLTRSTYYTDWYNYKDYATNYYGDVSKSKLKKNKVSSDAVTTVYTYCDAKNGKLKKVTESCTFYNESGKKVASLSYKGNVQAVYYTSGYRKGYLKSTPINSCTYKYSADKTKKNVSVQKQYVKGKLQTKTVYTWKKVKVSK